MQFSYAGRSFGRLRMVLGFVVAIIASVVFMAASADEAKAETALTSWYGPGFAGNPTASGEIYDPYGYTAAHKTLPLGTELVVSYGGNSLNVVVNDRGPYIEGRELDLSQGAAEYLGLTQAGVDYVDYYVADSGYSEPQAYTETQTTGDYSSSEVYSSESSYSSGGGSSAYSSQSSVSEVSYDGGGGAYTIQSGDTLTNVAASLGVSVDYLAQANGIYDVDYIVSGQTLYY